MDRRTALKATISLGALTLLEGCGTGATRPQSSPTQAGTASNVAPVAAPVVPPQSTQPITRVAIHPSIGIARVGNSKTDFFYGQDVPGPLAEPPGGFKDATGALKRQAARFRIYGYDAAGAVVREITADDGDIQWTVHVANEKAAWYDFETALDVPVAEPAGRRNDSYQGAARAQLVIDPGPRSIGGRQKSGVEFDGSSFLGVSVPLGELQTDEAGRLVVLGGAGHSFSPSNLPLTTFANNQGWCDDTSDGPVTARVTIGGQTFDADPAWVIVAPPNYGPSISAGYITMWDTIYDLMRRTHMVGPQVVTFADDIYPLFARLVDMQWLNAGVLRDNGPGTSGDFTSPSYVALLNDPSPANAAFRHEVLAMFRNPSYFEMQPVAIPPMYGDEVSIPATTNLQWYTVTYTQYEMLRAWADGNFYPSPPPPDAPRSLDTIPVSLQPATLDRATLDACLGGPFHPGCEATWPMRVASMYASPFRLRASASAERDFGEILTPQAALAPDGPLSGNGPGTVTRWMAVPWQADTASCRSGYEPEIDPYLPTFWPARVPNHILTEADYDTLMDTSQPLSARMAAFETRLFWLRNIVDADKIASITRMVSHWHQLGVVTEKPGPADLPTLPSTFKVETENTFTTPPLSKKEVFWKWRD